MRRRVLAVCCGIGVLQVDAAEDIAAWDHGGGFSEKPSVGIAADDRPALERLLRHCIRPCWSSERLTQAGDGERQICNFDKLRPDGSGQLTLTPLELLDRLARFIPPLHRHLHRHHGVFAPHAALRAQMAARAGGGNRRARRDVGTGDISVAAHRARSASDSRKPASRHWRAIGRGRVRPPLAEAAIAATFDARARARLIAWIYEVDPLR